jgi:kinesin family member 11
MLEARKIDYCMKVTFLELYNEEISDLLALEDQSRFPEDRQKRAISLMEDGKGGVVIRGLEEIVVYSPSDIYNLLECGSARRRTADTALNKQSRCLIILLPPFCTKIVLSNTKHSFCTCSRSHAVFSINIQVKETTVGNEELMKCGRLNLVDLAGSENIARSGAKEVLSPLPTHYSSNYMLVYSPHFVP